MAALDRYDDWESQVDARLAEHGCRDNQADEGPPALSELYDPATQAAINRGGPQPPGTPTPPRWRGGMAAGAVKAGLLGTAAALDERPDEEPVVELDRAIGGQKLEPVTVHLAWGDPAASVAVVRRWLF
jgi:hypothetical protein